MDVVGGAAAECGGAVGGGGGDGAHPRHRHSLSRPVWAIAVAVVLLRRPCACVGLRWLFHCEGGCRCGLRLSGPAAAGSLGRRRVLLF